MKKCLGCDWVMVPIKDQWNMNYKDVKGTVDWYYYGCEKCKTKVELDWQTEVNSDNKSKFRELVDKGVLKND